MAQMANKSSHPDFIENCLMIVIWTDFKFQIIREDDEIPSLNFNPSFNLWYNFLSKFLCSAFAYTIVIFILIFLDVYS